MKRITQFILCLALAVSAYGQGVGGNSVPRTVSGISNALDLISSTQGSVFYRGASGWEALTPGTSGQFLVTNGAGANPSWGTGTSGALPSQTGNSGKLVTTDGTNASWTTTPVATSLTAPAATNLTLTAGSGNQGVEIVGTGTGATATAVNTGGLRSANFGLSTVSGGASYFGGQIQAAGNILSNAVFAANSTTLLLRPNGLSVSSGQLSVTTAGNVDISGTTASTGVGTGALQVAGGIYAGAASVFGSTLSAAGVSTTVQAQLLSGAALNLQNASGDAQANILNIGGAGASIIDFRTASTSRLTIGATGAATFAGAVTTSSATLSGAGAIPITTSLVKYTSTGGAQALTLANGVDGQRLTIVHDVDGGSGVLTPTTKTGFSTVTFTNAGDTVSLVYVTTRGWMVTGSYGVTIAP